MKKERLSMVLIIVIVGAVILLSVGGYLVYTQITKSHKDSQENIQTQELTNEEIETISKSIVGLECLYDEDGDGQWGEDIYGSGIYLSENSITGKNLTEEGFNYNKGYILTNAHVAQLKKMTKEGYNFNFCSIFFNEIQGKYGRYLGMYTYDEKTHFLDDDIDIALLKYPEEIHGEKVEDRPSIPDDVLQSLLLSYYPICSSKGNIFDGVFPDEGIIGQKVYVFGYPSAGAEYQMSDPCFLNKLNPKFPCVGEPELVISERNLIVLDGIISGIDSNGDFYTTAKIDSGISGGLAVSKIDGEICIVGIATWLSGGDYENLGIIQSFWKIKNVLTASPIE